MAKIMPTYCFCRGFSRTRCWWYRWMTQYLSLSCSLINSVSWHCCWGKQSHPAHTTVVCFHFSVTSASSWILPCTYRNRKDGKVGKRYYLWGSRRGQECSWFMPVKVIYDAVALYHLSIHSYLTSIAFRSDLSCQCSSNETSLSLCLHVTYLYVPT